MLRFVIQPACQECGYKPLRADHIAEPGIITAQVIQHTIDAAMVVADLTGRNPNVFYELAIRHALRKPYLQIIQRGERIPFDVAAVRTIEIDHHDLESVEEAKGEMIRQMTAMKAKKETDSPISVAIDLDSLRKSGDPEQRQLGEVLAAIAELRSGLSSIEKRLAEPSSLLPRAYVRELIENAVSSVPSRTMPVGSRVVEELFIAVRGLTNSLEGRESSQVTKDELGVHLRRLEGLLQLLMPEGEARRTLAKGL